MDIACALFSPFFSRPFFFSSLPFHLSRGNTSGGAKLSPTPRLLEHRKRRGGREKNSHRRPHTKKAREKEEDAESCFLIPFLPLFFFPPSVLLSLD